MHLSLIINGQQETPPIQPQGIDAGLADQAADGRRIFLASRTKLVTQGFFAFCRRSKVFSAVSSRRASAAIQRAGRVPRLAIC